MFSTKVNSVNIMHLPRKCHIKSQILKEKSLINKNVIYTKLLKKYYVLWKNYKEMLKYK